jgi:hypothetical protein
MEEFLSKRHDDPAIFFKYGEEECIFLSREAALEVIRICLSQDIWVYSIEPGRWISANFEPDHGTMWSFDDSDNPTLEVCCPTASRI